jgi:hypothetical protein
MVRIAFISSNQFAPEEPVAQAATAVAIEHLRTLGAEVRNFNAPHDADKKTTDELAINVRDCNKWGPDIIVSIHSDSTGSGRAAKVVWPLVKSVSLISAADRMGRFIAKELGFKAQATAIRRDLMVLNDTHARCYLFEIGDFSSAAGLAWLQQNTARTGKAIADALADYLGLTTEDDMTPQQVEMLQYAAMWALEAKLDANLAKQYAKGDVNAAHVLEGKRADDIKLWRERWNVT